MKEINKIYNLDCDTFMDNTEIKVDVILTSPPYNTARVRKTQRGMEIHMDRYDLHNDNMTDEEYIEWTINKFKGFDKLLKENGVILYNLSYSSENSHLIWLTISEIINKTNFITSDTIVWKKNSALPNNTSSNKLTRICEFVFVFCRKGELHTFNSNKKVKSVGKNNQKYYENTFNFIEAKNNDGSTKLNKATFSTELCEKLLNMYAKDGSLVFDPFMGTGTTAIACKNLGLDYIGTELSSNQCVYAENRVGNT